MCGTKPSGAWCAERVGELGDRRDRPRPGGPSTPRGSTSPTATATDRSPGCGTQKPGGRQWRSSTARARRSPAPGRSVPGSGPGRPATRGGAHPASSLTGRWARRLGSIMPTCAIVSFRLGLTDGVSIVADAGPTPSGARVRRGHRGRRRSGRPARRRAWRRRRRPARDAGAGPHRSARSRTALRDADLVVVENLCTIPLNLPAARAVAAVLAGRPAILHHHDPPWQRPQLAHVTELPPRRSGVAPRHHQRADPRASSPSAASTATTIYNGFDVHPGRATVPLTRRRLGVADDELLVAHPVRAIERKDVARRPARCPRHSAAPTGCSARPSSATGPSSTGCSPAPAAA